MPPAQPELRIPVVEGHLEGTVILYDTRACCMPRLIYKFELILYSAA